MALAPELASFGDGTAAPGASGITVGGGGFGAFPGELWIYENADRTGNSDQLSITGAWNDIQITGVEVPAVLANVSGTRYLFLQREDLAWSQGLALSLLVSAVGTTGVRYIRSTRRGRSF